jgi:mono/diheme cytochrome c family protein
MAMGSRLLLGGGVLAVSAALAASGPATTPAVKATPPLPYARAIDPTPLERTPARIARGKYLVEGVTPCLFCHSPRDWKQPGAPSADGMKAAGLVMYEDKDTRVVASNLTPDVETGAGGWPDDAMVRAIREGVGHDGRPLKTMWWWAFRRLSDEDVRSIVVYLRTLPPVHNPLPETRISQAERDRLVKKLHPLTEPVPQPDASTPLARGRYLIGISDCVGCHTAWEAPRNAGLYAGGNLIERGEHKAFSANLTPDPTGMPYDEQTFVTFMRNGKFNTLSPMMPWFVFRNMSDSDLADIRTAMRRLWPVVHRVNNSEMPTHCPICLQEHGGGDSNHVQPPPTGVAVPRAKLEQYVGNYRSRDDGQILEVRFKDGHLVTAADKEEREMIALPDGRFYEVGGSGVPLRFGLDAQGKVVTMVEEEVEDYTYDRVPPAGPSE